MRSSKRCLAVLFLLAGAALAEGKKPSPAPQKPGTKQVPALPEEDPCRVRCMVQQGNCMAPCVAGPDPEAPGNQKQVMACVTKCSKEGEPCLEKCDREAARKGTKRRAAPQ